MKRRTFLSLTALFPAIFASAENETRCSPNEQPIPTEPAKDTSSMLYGYMVHTFTVEERRAYEMRQTHLKQTLG